MIFVSLVIARQSEARSLRGRGSFEFFRRQLHFQALPKTPRRRPSTSPSPHQNSSPAAPDAAAPENASAPQSAAGPDASPPSAQSSPHHSHCLHIPPAPPSRFWQSLSSPNSRN